MAKGRLPGKRVFLGVYSRENGARKAFGASVLNEFEFLTRLHFSKKTGEDNGIMCTTVILPRSITVVYM